MSEVAAAWPSTSTGRKREDILRPDLTDFKLHSNFKTSHPTFHQHQHQRSSYLSH